MNSFFFSLSRVLRDPHSFPTRRSSDLPFIAMECLEGKTLRELTFGRRLELERLLEDRKSTRLNSSHANISYAVFCLKKKKQIRHCRSSFRPGSRGRADSRKLENAS